MSRDNKNICVVRLEKNHKDFCWDALLSNGASVQIKQDQIDNCRYIPTGYWISKNKEGPGFLTRPVTAIDMAEYILDLENGDNRFHTPFSEQLQIMEKLT